MRKILACLFVCVGLCLLVILGAKYKMYTIRKSSAYERSVNTRKLAEQGNAEAQFEIGALYNFGEDGIQKDLREAVKWYKKSADQGYALAQRALGSCYACGTGVEKDTQDAVKWFRKAAEQGDSAAQCMLGDHYAAGEGVKKDMKEAVKWFRMAAEQGDFSAQHALGDCYAKGEGVEKDTKEAVKWLGRAEMTEHNIYPEKLQIKIREKLVPVH